VHPVRNQLIDSSTCAKLVFFVRRKPTRKHLERY
jgi:hypothetical protein